MSDKEYKFIIYFKYIHQKLRIAFLSFAPKTIKNNEKQILILLLGALSISTAFGIDNMGLLNEKEVANEKPAAHSAGKKLSKGTWLLGGTLSAKSNNLSDIDLLVIDVEDFDQRAFNEIGRASCRERV